MRSAPRRRRRIMSRSRQAGQGLVEYALIFVLIVVIAITSLTFFGTTVSGYLTAIGTAL